MPVWNTTLRLKDVWRNDGASFHETRDAIVDRIREHPWYEQNTTVMYFVGILAEAEDPGEFDDLFQYIYDEADADRVWLETF